jgi:hypothetical protein
MVGRTISTRLDKGSDVKVEGDKVTDASGTAAIINDLNNPNVVYDVKVKGNKLK